MELGDWLKRDLAKLIYGEMECGNPITGWLITCVNEKFIPLIFMCKVLMYIWILMADISIVLLFLLCWLYVSFVTKFMYGSQHVFTYI